MRPFPCRWPQPQRKELRAVRRSFHDYHDCSGRIPGHTRRALPVGPRFELETNGFQFYAIADLDKTSQLTEVLPGCTVTVTGGDDSLFPGSGSCDEPERDNKRYPCPA